MEGLKIVEFEVETNGEIIEEKLLRRNDRENITNCPTPEIIKLPTVLMLRNEHDREKEREMERGGESPMEIDSPPPLWLKTPTSPVTNSPRTTDNNDIHTNAHNHTPTNTNTNTNFSNLRPSGLSSAPGGFSSSSMDEISSPLTVGLKSSPSTPRSPFLRTLISPGSGGNNQMVCGSNGKSPLRSCHTNSDAAVHLRRLTTATFMNSSPPQQRSPTVLMMLNRKGNTPQSQKKKRTDPTKVAAAAALVTSSTTAWHLHLPIILMNYFQLIFNTFIGIGILYLSFSATRTILHDAQLKVDERLQVMMSEIAHCSRQYQENRCSPDQRVPAMEKVCMDWETCMYRDPSTTSRARLHAETIAEILNGFFGAISTKTFILMIGGTVLVLTLFNVAFYFGRHSHSHSHSQNQVHNQNHQIQYQHHSQSQNQIGFSNQSSPLMLK